MKTLNRLFGALAYVPKKTAIVSLAALAILVPAASFAYGPNRTTYTMAKPADHVTFNSITDNPNVGDERNFVGIREDGSNGSWQDNINVQPGKTYVVRMYVHNNAASNLNLVAHDVTAKFNLPTNTAKSIDVFGYIDSSNAKPKEVYDQATFTSANDFNLAVVDGSLLYENNHWTDGTHFSNEGDVFTSKGIELGYDKKDGDIPGCLQYSGYLSFKVKPQFASTPTQTTDYTVTKQVSKHGANAWTDNYTAQPGETVDFLVAYKNTGTTQQNNVVIKDALPIGLNYVSGSTTYGNATHPSGAAGSDTITSSGLALGDYTANSNAYAIFSATVANEDALQCGLNTLTNTASVSSNGNGSKTDTAQVSVTRTCTTPVTPVTTTPTTPSTPSDIVPVVSTTPTTIPSTGPSEIVGGIFGASSLGLGVQHYLASRRALKAAVSLK